MHKQIGIATAVIGAIAILGALLSLNYPDFSKWFPVLLIAGSGAVWMGIKKYRWA